LGNCELVINTISAGDTSQANASFSIKDSFEFAWRTLIGKFWFLLPVQYAIGAGSAGINSWIKAEPFHSIAGAMYVSVSEDVFNTFQKSCSTIIRTWSTRGFCRKIS
jgi:hypothetical protein